jgi:murein DD-endopeptidase MepM/ murein hydrolase activator NlpD
LAQLRVVIACVFLLLTCVLVCDGQTADHFEFPTRNYEQALLPPHFLLFGEPNSNYGNKLHAAEDIRASSHGMEVFAAAAGRVMLARTWKDCPNWGYILVIEHTLPDGTKVCSIYGHLDATTVLVAENQTVDRPGILLGKTGNYSCWKEHLHFGIHIGPFGRSVGSYPSWLTGYLPPAQFPQDYVKPSDFIRTHVTSNVVRTEATLDGNPWSGNVDFTIVGPGPVVALICPKGGCTLPVETSGLAPGQYTFTYNSGGPANSALTGVSPSTTQTLTAGGSITFRLQFTSHTPVTPGSCQPWSSLSVLVDNDAKTVASYVPKGCWSCAATGISAVNIEGSSLSPTLVPTADVINSCGSNAITKQTVCTANTAHVYVLKGTALDSSVSPNPLSSSGSGIIDFSGGSCTNCGVAMDAIHSKATIGLAFSPFVGGFQFLSLNSPLTFQPSFATMDILKNISEDPLIDPTRNTFGLNTLTGNPAGALLLSPSEDNNYEIIDVTTSVPAFFERSISNVAGEADSGAEDCETGIVLAPYEFTFPSQLFVADLASAVFTPGSPGSWTSLSAVNTLTGSNLFCAGPSGVAIAQGTHTGIVTDEFGCNAVTAIALPPTPGVVTLPGWMTCSIPNDPTGQSFAIGDDPHTVTAYQSPNNGHAYALIANKAPSGTPTFLARIDLTMMLSLTESSPGSHVCGSGTIPSSVVNFIPVP